MMRKVKSWLGEQKSAWKNLTWSDYLWLGLIPALWFSYQPLISFGDFANMHLELSIPLIYLVILAATQLPSIWRARAKLMKNRAVWLVASLVVWQSLSVIWSDNAARGILTAGIVWLLFATFLAALAKTNWRELMPRIFQVVMVSAVVMSLFALYQFIAGLWLAREVTLLCAGCVAGQFGFVRVTGFAIEPQFFGSLLILPLLWLAARGLKLDKTESNSRANWILYGFLLFILVLTLSRGAIYAVVIGLIVLLIISFIQKKVWRGQLLLVGVGLISLILAIAAQGVAAVANPATNDTFRASVARSVSQLSLGIINLAPPAETTDNRNSSELTEDATKSVELTDSASAQNISEPVVEPNPDQPRFDGYVEVSTDTRTNLAKLGLQTWAQNLRVMVAGVGLGGSGVAMRDYTHKIDAMEITQNEFVERLLEGGVVGLVLFAAVIVGWFYLTRRAKWLWAVGAAFLIQWNFFSGLPNALHVYLFFAVCLAVILQRQNFASSVKLKQKIPK
jgi:hypothetical protein